MDQGLISDKSIAALDKLINRAITPGDQIVLPDDDGNLIRGVVTSVGNGQIFLKDWSYLQG